MSGSRGARGARTKRRIARQHAHAHAHRCMRAAACTHKDRPLGGGRPAGGGLPVPVTRRGSPPARARSPPRTRGRRRAAPQVPRRGCGGERHTRPREPPRHGQMPTFWVWGWVPCGRRALRAVPRRGSPPARTRASPRAHGRRMTRLPRPQGEGAVASPYSCGLDRPHEIYHRQRVLKRAGLQPFREHVPLV